MVGSALAWLGGEDPDILKEKKKEKATEDGAGSAPGLPSDLNSGPPPGMPPPVPAHVLEARPPPPPIPGSAQATATAAAASSSASAAATATALVAAVAAASAAAAEEETAAPAKKAIFDTYWDKEAIDRGLRDGSLMKGEIRVNGKSLSTAYVHPIGASTNDNDVKILGKAARNRAMHNDIVVVKFVGEEEARDWTGNAADSREAAAEQEEDTQVAAATAAEAISAPPGLGGDDSDDELIDLSGFGPQHEADGTGQQERRYGKVIGILEAKGSDRMIVCTIQPNPRRKGDDRSNGIVEEDDKWLLAHPTDKRMPWMRLRLNDETRKALDLTQLPKKLDPYQFWTIKMVVWQETAQMPLCKLVGESLGRAGDLEAEQRHALIEHGLDEHEAEFPDDLLDEVDQIVIKAQREFESECARRTDLRTRRIFTIDPATAKDLDDAIHCDVDLERREVEIGVHIADVGHFVNLGCRADKEAQFRTTSVYLINRVLPMLPHALCNHLCSLNPNEPKLAFSAFFRLNMDTGELVETGPYKPWFKKTAINSVCRLNYDEVQEMLDGKEIDTPEVYGGYEWKDIVKDIDVLYDVCGKVRRGRFEGGALSISKRKMIFHTRESEDGLPRGYHLEHHSASHWIIEELMLLANRCVAKHLAESVLGNFAVLRNHASPDTDKAADLAKMMQDNLGLDWEAYNAGSIYRCCQAIHRKYGEMLGLCVEMMVMRAGMQQAKYFVYNAEAETDCHHFALDFDYYTHFTSPIRRYPDIMVHRVLAVLLGEGDYSSYQQEDEADIQVNACNDKKMATKRCSEMIDRAVFCIYLRTMKSWFYTIGTVLSFKEHDANDGTASRGEVTLYCAQLGRESQVKLRAGDGSVESLENMGLFCNGVEDELMLPENWRFCSRGLLELEWLPADGDKTRRKRQVLQTLSCVPIVIIPTQSVPIDYQIFFVSPFKRQDLFEEVPKAAADGFAWKETEEEGVEVVHDARG